MTALRHGIEHLGAGTIARVAALREMVALYCDTIAAFASKEGRRHLSLRQIVNQLLFTGVDAIMLVSIIALACGVIIAIQAVTTVPQFGAGEYFGKIMVIAMVRELGPFFTSLVVIGRSGAALAAYLGNMKVTKEIAALDAMGVDRVYFLVMPAFAGMIIAMLCLSLYFDIIGVLGGLAVADAITGESFFKSVVTVFDALSMRDIGASLFKCLVFGSVISIISCHYGLAVENIRIVPRAVFRTVVAALGTTILINMIVTVLFYAL